MRRAALALVLLVLPGPALADGGSWLLPPPSPSPHATTSPPRPPPPSPEDEPPAPSPWPDRDFGESLLRVAMREHLEDAWTIRAAALHPDETVLAVALDERVVLWSLSTGRPLRTLLGHQGDVRELTWLDEGRRLASADRAGRVHVWGARRSSPVASMEVPAGYGGVGALLPLPDGRLLACGIDACRLLDVDSGEAREAAIPGVVYDLTGPPEGRTSVSGYALGWDGLRRLSTGADGALAVGRPSPMRAARGRSTVLAVSEAGRRLAVGEAQGRIRIHGLTEHEGPGPVLRVLDDGLGEPESLSFDPDGALLAAGSRTGEVHVHEVAGGRRLALLRGHDAGVTAVRFFAASTRLLTASADGTFRVWNVDHDG